MYTLWYFIQLQICVPPNDSYFPPVYCQEEVAKTRNGHLGDLTKITMFFLSNVKICKSASFDRVGRF